MNDQQRISAALERLFRTYPSPARGSTEDEITRDRIATAKVYVDAVAPYSAEDVEAAVQAFLTGSVPGHNTAFVPTAPMVGSACRRAMETRVEIQNRARRLRPALPRPDIAHTPEERERARAQVQEFVAAQSAPLIEQRAAEQQARDRLARHDSFFADEFIPTDGGVGRISKTLAAKLGYSVGAPESDREAG